MGSMFRGTGFINRTLGKKEINALIQCALLEGNISSLSEGIKDITFGAAALSGFSISVEDFDFRLEMSKTSRSTKQYKTRKKRRKVIARERGTVTLQERYYRVRSKWRQRDITPLANVLERLHTLYPYNDLLVSCMHDARGSKFHLRQLLVARGRMVDPQGRILRSVIQSGLVDGLSTAEFVISAFGARKGLIDTGIKTADAGYLSRRLVELARNIVVRKRSCGPNRGIAAIDLVSTALRPFSLKSDRLAGRQVIRSLMLSTTGETVHRGDFLSTKVLDKCGLYDLQNLWVRIPFTCNLKIADGSLCQDCYGWGLTQEPVILGTAVGVIAGQSIGEPCTQMTLRTRHTSGTVNESALLGPKEAVSHANKIQEGSYNTKTDTSPSDLKDPNRSDTTANATPHAATEQHTLEESFPLLGRTRSFSDSSQTTSYAQSSSPIPTTSQPPAEENVIRSNSSAILKSEISSVRSTKANLESASLKTNSQASKQLYFSKIFKEKTKFTNAKKQKILQNFFQTLINDADYDEYAGWKPKPIRAPYDGYVVLGLPPKTKREITFRTRTGRSVYLVNHVAIKFISKNFTVLIPTAHPDEKSFIALYSLRRHRRVQRGAVIGYFLYPCLRSSEGLLFASVRNKLARELPEVDYDPGRNSLGGAVGPKHDGVVIHDLFIKPNVNNFLRVVSAGHLWVLLGKWYTLPRSFKCLIKVGRPFLPGTRIAEKSMINRYSGVVNFQTDVMKPTTLHMRIVNSHATLRNARLFSSYSGIPILKFENGECLRLRLPKFSSTHSRSVTDKIFQTYDIIATGPCNQYVIRTGGTLVYNLDKKFSKKSTNKKRSDPLKNSFDGQIYWLPKETYILESKHLIPTITNGMFLEKGTSLTDEIFTKISGLCFIRRIQKNSHITIMPGELMEYDAKTIKPKEWTEGFIDRGQTLFKQLFMQDVVYVSFINLEARRNRPRDLKLFFRTVYTFQVQKNRLTQQDVASVTLSVKNRCRFKSVLVGPKNWTEFNTNSSVRPILSCLVVDKEVMDTNLHIDFEIVKNIKNTYTLRMSQYENFDMADLARHENTTRGLRAVMAISVIEKQYVAAQTQLASLTLRIPTAGLLDQYSINCEQSDELLIIRSADFKLIRHHSSGNELFVRVGDLVPLGSPISLVSRSTCSGQIFKIDETFVYIRKGEILALRRNTKLIVPYGKIVHRARPIAIILADLSKVGSIRDITHTVPILSRLLELHGRRHRALTAILAPVAGYVDYADTHIVISDSNGSTTAMLTYTWVADNNAPLFTSGNYVDWLQPLTTGPMDYFRRMYLLVRRYLRYTSGYHACRHTILYTQLDYWKRFIMAMLNMIYA
jgi:hypothetical protein